MKTIFYSLNRKKNFLSFKLFTSYSQEKSNHKNLTTYLTDSSYFTSLLKIYSRLQLLLQIVYPQALFHANTLEKQKKEKDNQLNLEKQQIIDRPGVWRKETGAIFGDSLLNEIDERRILKTHPVKVRFCPGACIKDMYHYSIPILEKKWHYILHVGTNDVADCSHQ